IWAKVRFSADQGGMTLMEVARSAGEPHSEDRGFNPHTSRRLPQHRLAAYAEALHDDNLRQLASEDIYWDEVVSIDSTGEHQVYDLAVPETHNFIAQDILVHNTSLALNIALHSALEAKKAVAIFSLEMSKEQLTERLLTEQAQIDAQRLHRGLLTEAEFDRVSNALGPLGEASIFIDDTPVMDELTLQLKARQAKMRHSIDMILVDYLQLMHGRAQVPPRPHPLLQPGDPPARTRYGVTGMVIILVGGQWGDEGKGKVIDFLAAKAQMVIRSQGGNNAGHTVITEDGEFKFQLIPSGILYPQCTCVIGNGVVVDPIVLLKEITQLRERGIEPKNLI